MSQPNFEMIKHYNPNLYCHVCTYAITLMQWDYSHVIIIEVGGNVRGFDLIESAAEAIYDTLEASDNCTVIELVNPKGEILICRDDEEEGEEWLKEMIVSIVLIKQEREE